MGERKRRLDAISKGILPQRKFLSEFAVSLFSASWLMITPDQLMSDGEIRAEDKQIIEGCHIYLICRRPAQRFNPDDFKFEDGRISGSLIYRIEGGEIRTPFEWPFELYDGAVRVQLTYPYRKIATISPEGKIERYLPANALSLWGAVHDERLRQFEVLYVGQAFGDGSRDAFTRLRSHTTLQKILANTVAEYPDDEVMIFTFKYDPYRVLASFDGRTKGTISGEEDERRYSKLFHGGLSEKQQVCLAEAGLIRYFQPKYNKIYRDSFPAADQKVLNECYLMDFSALVVEIDTEYYRVSLYSEATFPAEHHTARFNLVDPRTRWGFLTFVDDDGSPSEMPGTIQTTKFA